MNFFGEDTSILMILYYLSGPILAAFGIVAVLQLRMMKKQLEIASRDNVFETTMKLIDFYETKIFNASNKINTMIHIQGISGRDTVCVNFNCQNIEKETKEKYGKLFLSDANFFITYLNNLDLFSVLIKSGNANKEILYNLKGVSFCENVELISGIILYLREIDNKKVYDNSVSLYYEWKTKLNNF